MIHPNHAQHHTHLIYEQPLNRTNNSPSCCLKKQKGPISLSIALLKRLPVPLANSDESNRQQLQQRFFRFSNGFNRLERLDDGVGVLFRLGLAAQVAGYRLW